MPQTFKNAIAWSCPRLLILAVYATGWFWLLLGLPVAFLTQSMDDWCAYWSLYTVREIKHTTRQFFSKRILI